MYLEAIQRRKSFITETGQPFPLKKNNYKYDVKDSEFTDAALNLSKGNKYVEKVNPKTFQIINSLQGHISESKTKK